MKYAAVCTVLIACLGTLPSRLAIQPPQDQHLEPATRIDQILSSANDPDLPGGYAAAVILDGQVIFMKGYGYANSELDVPFTPSTVHDFASVAKQFTGYAVALLVKRGILSLDDDIREYLPELSHLEQRITIDHLVHHTSGIRDFVALVKISGRFLEDVITDDFIFNLIQQQRELNFPPGDQYAYSNSGYLLLARIVSRVTGQEFPLWMKENVFDPLGMKDTCIITHPGTLLKNRADCYVQDENGTYRRSPSSLASHGSSSLFSTVEDMTKWLLNFETCEVGDPDIFNLMYQPAVLNNGSETAYGFGLSLGERRGLKVYEHGGSWRGYLCSTARIPEQRFGLIFVTNRRPPGAYVEGDIYDACLSRFYADAPPSVSPVAPGSIDIDPQTVDTYTGTFTRDGRRRILCLERTDSRLLLHLDNNDPAEAYAVSSDQFYCPSWGYRFQFEKDDDGEVIRLAFLVGGNRINYEKTDVTSLGPGELAGLCGEYVSEEVCTAYTLVVENGQLIARHFHNEDVHLSQKLTDYFVGDQWWFQSVDFLRNSEGNVAGFRVSADENRVRNVLFLRTDLACPR